MLGERLGMIYEVFINEAQQENQNTFFSFNHTMYRGNQHQKPWSPMTSFYIRRN
jgi:hypothetical protein